MLRLRLRGPSGTATGSFDGAASIESFLVAASEQLGCAGAKIDMLVGFPPKQCEVSGAPLSSVVGSGDTVVLNVIAAPAPAPAPAAAPAPESVGPTPALGGMWACGGHRLVLERASPASSGGGGRGSCDGPAALAACHRVRVASPGALQRLGWHTTRGVRLDLHRHTNLFTGQATREVTISRRRYGCAIRVLSMTPASAWNAPCPCKIMQREGTAAIGHFRRD